jgi:LacI family transcriptional regulator
MSVGTDRVQGWRDEVESAGLESDLIEFGDFTPQGGAEAMRRLLERGVPFDGLFAASAQMASGAIGVLREHGLSIPGDVGITTIDNDFYATGANPPLTTIDQPSVEQGVMIAELLVKLLAGESVSRLTIMPTHLIERESV